MKTDTLNQYFSHDYKARSDRKLVNLQKKHGLAGIGAYWCIIEMLYEEGGYISQEEYADIAFELRTDFNTIKSVVEDFKLFEIKSQKFFSKAVLKRLNKRIEKSQKARENANSRWSKNQNNSKLNQENANALQNKKVRIANKRKESKGKEIKRKESKGNNNINSLRERKKIMDNSLDKNLENKLDNQITIQQEKDKNDVKFSSAKKERNIIPPTLDMVTNYCQERNNNISPQMFIDHYAAKGWKIGKEKMIDWQAAIRTWERRSKEITESNQTKPKQRVYGRT